jgi:hypothetical protein
MLFDSQLLAANLAQRVIFRVRSAKEVKLSSRTPLSIQLSLGSRPGIGSVAIVIFLVVVVVGASSTAYYVLVLSPASISNKPKFNSCSDRKEFVYDRWLVRVDYFQRFVQLQSTPWSERRTLVQQQHVQGLQLGPGGVGFVQFLDKSQQLQWWWNRTRHDDRSH